MTRQFYGGWIPGLCETYLRELCQSTLQAAALTQWTRLYERAAGLRSGL